MYGSKLVKNSVTYFMLLLYASFDMIYAMITATYHVLKDAH